MATQEYRNIWKELDEIHKQLIILNDVIFQKNKVALFHDDSNVVQQKSEHGNILKGLDEMRKLLTQLNDKSTIGTDHSGSTTSPTIKPSEPIDDKGGLVKHISTQTHTSTNLCIPDLNDVVETLKTKGCNFGDARWMDLGLALGLYMSTLEEIELNFNKNPSRCLMKAIDKWLRRADNVMSKGRPSWDTLADALRRIDENTSAQYITEQRMRLEVLSASNDAVRDGAIINVVKDASQSLVDQNITKIDELMEKMESITSKPQEDINHQLIEMKKEIKQLNEINEQLKVHLDELNQLKHKLQETDLAKRQISHDLDKYKSLYETLEVQLQSEIEELTIKQKNTEIVLKQLKSSNKDITHQLETKTKQLEELTEIHMTTKSELDQLKQKELEQTSVQDIEGKMLSLSRQLREREEEVKQLSTEIKDLQFQNEKHMSLKEKSERIMSSSIEKEVPSPKRHDTEMERRVKWNRSKCNSSYIVTLTSPTPSDCITLIRHLQESSANRRPCDGIRLWSSSADSANILLSLLHQTNVKKLTISHTQLTTESLQCVCHLISINYLEFLNITNTSLSTSGGLLTDAISTNISLERLLLMGNRLTDNDMGNISRTLTINTTLQRLTLKNCNITDDGLVQLSNGLTYNRTLKVLNISKNNLVTSTTAVCDIIHNSSLTDLNFTNTSLPSDSIPQLLDALSTNKTIKLGIDKQHIERCKQHKNYQHIQDRLEFI